MIRAYSPELDGTSELNTDDIIFSKSLLACYDGQLNWGGLIYRTR